MPEATSGAQRASGHPHARLIIVALAALLALGGLAANPPTSNAATGLKVAIVVGPFESRTERYRDQADSLAAIAKAYGATVAKIYSPNASWSKVKRYATGANLFIYLGHGNGWPSPYKPFQTRTKDGLGLNRRSGEGNSNLKYWGEYYVRRELHLAANAVVILNHACYTAGSSEPGRADPSKSTAKQRVDNFGAGFLDTGAKAVFAEAHNSIAYILHGLFATDKTMSQIFWSSGSASGAYDFTFSSTRTPGMKATVDPSRPGKYYRSVIGKLDMTAATWRSE
ncbi:MAG: hypothetical protein ACHQ02_03570 [Candidatus Limnocylindrales bacterium]